MTKKEILKKLKILENSILQQPENDSYIFRNFYEYLRTSYLRLDTEVNHIMHIDNSKEGKIDLEHFERKIQFLITLSNQISSNAPESMHRIGYGCCLLHSIMSVDFAFNHFHEISLPDNLKTFEFLYPGLNRKIYKCYDSKSVNEQDKYGCKSIGCIVNRTLSSPFFFFRKYPVTDIWYNEVGLDFQWRPTALKDFPNNYYAIGYQGSMGENFIYTSINEKRKILFRVGFAAKSSKMWMLAFEKFEFKTKEFVEKIELIYDILGKMEYKIKLRNGILIEGDSRINFEKIEEEIIHAASKG